jgi:hypothetical protein
MTPCRPLLAIVLTVWLAAPGWSNQAVILQIRLVEGEGAVVRAGSRAARPVTVQVTDETGKPVEAVAVSFRLPDDGPAGVFPSGLKSELILTDAQGRASARDIRWNRTAGPAQIRIVASKGPARAGTLASVYVSDTASGGGAKWKWIVLGASAGAAAGGLAYGLSRGSGRTSGSAQAPTIGVPVITVGAPQ